MISSKNMFFGGLKPSAGDFLLVIDWRPRTQLRREEMTAIEKEDLFY